MDISRRLAKLHDQRKHIIAAIRALELLASSRSKRRGRGQRATGHNNKPKAD